MHTRLRFLAVLVSAGVAAAATSRTIDSVSVVPNDIVQGSGVVTITAGISDSTVYPTQVTLVTADATHQVLGTLIQQADPTVFLLKSSFASLPAGTYSLQVSASFRGVMKRVLSTPPFSLTIRMSGSKDCTYAVRGGTPTVAGTGELGRLYVTAPDGCAWSATLTPAAAWVTFTSSSGSGDGVVAYQVMANPGPLRSTVLDVAGFSLPITQMAATGMEPWPGYLYFGIPASGTLAYFANAPNAPVGSTESWILNPSQSAPIGTVPSPFGLVYLLQANMGMASRVGRIVVAGSSLLILQKGLGSGSGFVDGPPESSGVPWDEFVRLVAGGPGSPAHCATGVNYFCPDANITRGEMAVLLVRARMGDSFAYNATPYFGDVSAANPQFPYVQYLADWIGAANMGCGSGNFCPDAQMTRGKAAEMLMRARYGITGTFPAFYSNNVFADVPPGTLMQCANRMFELGMTKGCAATSDPTRLFCPNNPLTRAWAAMWISWAVLAP
jgi:hypothetical protein